ncbi:phosphate ABC transporter, permease protein PstA [Melioribacter roseus P3M-2]|uniref:Phosphate transport system permease protein PstA n=1 Tax=Melioribacter roseus (strain DSM 23840 / JCM 17771 / VKM B-2668 / P3M-2) TaxID=1191523 RepID=I7A3S9_MELRP|nr:phosphate ABC transporter permease PstA [Melioribacter roseus]AFN75868.1 phosphate ABC transporter, permease protein PstA [Melioribacter roseus P3M-2]
METELKKYKRRLKYRKAVNLAVNSLTFLAALIAILPLFLIFYYTVSKGIGRLNLEFFVEMPKPVGEPGGGMANAIVGTLILVGIGGAIGLPVGIMSGIYLAEFGKNKFGQLLRFLTDVLSGIPSIVVGVVAYTLVVIPMKQFSALAGGVALAILMIPTITRTTEEMIKLVPHSYREAGLGLGIPKWKTSLFIILRTAWKGIATGVLLGLSRAAGETAPLLFTALGNRFWSTNVFEPIASLTVYIYDYARAPFEDWNAQAWTAALVLIILISLLSLTFKIITRSKYKTN